MAAVAAPAGPVAGTAAGVRSQAHALEALTRLWDAAGVAWLRLRPRDDEAARGPVVDEDLLVAAVDVDRARVLAQGLGYLEVPAPGRGGHRFWWAYDEAGGGWTKLDLLTELAFGPLGALRSTAAAGCLARRERRQGTSVPLAADAFWLLLLHDLLDRRTLPLEHRAELARTAPTATADHPLAMLLRPACPRGFDPAHLQALVQAEAWPALEAAAPRIGRRWWAPAPLRARLRLGEQRLRRRLASLGLPPRQGLSVALLGPDGAGKSSLLDALAGIPAVPVRRIYLGLYGGGLGTAGGGRAFARRLLVAWRGELAGRWGRARGELVVFDRHPLEIARLGPARGRARLRRWLLAHAIPQPDLLLVLDAPAEVLAARRPGYTLEQLAAQRAAYRGLAERSARAVLVDATAEPAIVQRRATAAIWRRAVQRGRW